MKQKKYMLNIDHPCMQEWAAMTQTADGKFCSHCSKTVVDFTQCTDHEIVQVIERTSGKICGRLTKQQLNRVLVAYQPANSSRLNSVLAGLMTLGLAGSAFAANQVQSQMEVVSGLDERNRQEEELNTQASTTDTLRYVVQGKVIDAKTKEPLLFATVRIKDIKIGVTTDVEGYFKLTIPDSLVTDQICLVITYIGYKTTEMVINKKDLPLTRDFLVVDAENVLMGDVIIKEKKK